MFDVLIESDPHLKPKKTVFSVAISLFLHAVVLVLAIILPLFFTETLSPALVVTYLAAPPPPPPPPPPPLASTATPAKVPKVVPQTPGQMRSPIAIPTVIAMVEDLSLIHI